MSLLRIVQVNKLYSPEIGGVETVVQDIAEGLNSKTDMQVLVCQRKGRGVKETINGVKVTRATSFGTWLSMPLSIDFLRQFRRLVKDADIIQIHVPFPLADLAIRFFRFKGKLVVWWHSDIVRQKMMLRLLRPFVNNTLKRANSIIVASKAHIASSIFLPKFADKCKVIPYGLDFAEYDVPVEKDFLTKRLNNPQNKKLLFVGRLVYYKGIHLLIDSMKDVVGAELFIVGSGVLDEQLKATAWQYGLEDRVHFLGELPRESLLSAYRDCEVFVFPSCANSEAFGITQIEAMYYGKPVVNTDLPTAVPWVSVHEETGLTVSVGNVAAMSAAIMRLVNDDTLREEYGVNAVARVRALFNQQHMLDEIYSKYKRLVKARSKSH